MLALSVVVVNEAISGVHSDLTGKSFRHVDDYRTVWSTDSGVVVQARPKNTTDQYEVFIPWSNVKYTAPLSGHTYLPDVVPPGPKRKKFLK